MFMFLVILFFFFFFQAEDGIRDHCVTGVQTCALPISVTGGRLERQNSQGSISLVPPPQPKPRVHRLLPMLRRLFRRSEEHTSELQSHSDLVCRLLLEKKKKKINVPLASQEAAEHTAAA